LTQLVINPHYSRVSEFLQRRRLRVAATRISVGG
jgi:hypothetical protein